MLTVNPSLSTSGNTGSVSVRLMGHETVIPDQLDDPRGSVWNPGPAQARDLSGCNAPLPYKEGCEGFLAAFGHSVFFQETRQGVIAVKGED